MKFEDLEVWKRSTQLSVELYTFFEGFNGYGFKDQITRSGLSISSNIAEGFERNSKKDFIRFVQYAKGSCGELRSQIYVGIKAGYISDDQGNKWMQETTEISAMLMGLKKSLKSQLDSEAESAVL